MLDETSELRRQLFAELRPQGIIETALADEILIALLRLRRCAQSESGADPDQKHIDRERTQAHGLLLRSNAELRRLRKDRTASEHIPQAEVAVSAPAPTPELPASEPASIPRSAPCPCGSGLKYKRCHGWNAPASPRSASTSRTHHPSGVPPHVQASPPSGSPTC